MLKKIADLCWGGRVHSVLYHSGCLDDLPWGSEAFECSVLLRVPDWDQDEMHDVALALSRSRVSWVSTAGPNCERLHDLIDTTSVAIGRQLNVGDGNPMTTWNDDVETSRDFASLACMSFNGDEDLLMLIFGNEHDYRNLVQHLKVLIAAINAEEDVPK